MHLGSQVKWTVWTRAAAGAAGTSSDGAAAVIALARFAEAMAKTRAPMAKAVRMARCMGISSAFAPPPEVGG
jgi:hypothetical protein